MGYKFVITEEQGYIMTALFDGDRCDDLLLSVNSAENAPVIGDIWIGHVKRVLPNIHAAFVDIMPGVTGYLPLNGHDDIKAEQDIPVQIVKEAVKSKDMMLTADFSISGRFCAMTIGKRGVGISKKINDTELREKLLERARNILSPSADEPYVGTVIRTNAVEADDDAFLRDLLNTKEEMDRILLASKHRTVYSRLYHAPDPEISLIRDMHAPIEKIVTDIPEEAEKIRGFFADTEKITSVLSLYEDESLALRKLYRLDSLLDEVFKKTVWLPSGGSIVLEVTEALTVIDVNTGKTDKKRTKEENFLQTNIEAAREAARQIRLRNYSGMILIDFINMREKSNLKELEKELTKDLSRDRITCRFMDFTKLGLAEITREKTSRPLHEIIRKKG
ncbi:ribonuclease G [Lachnospiraceae bacterium]|nr:ribonuclease G [Lachnospiraceae bacterium]